MKTREVAIVPHDSAAKTYAVRVRRRSWLGFWWRWRGLITVQKQQSWPYELARLYADQALTNGWVPGEYPWQALPIIERDAEESGYLG